MVVQYSTPQSEFVPTSKNPYEDMSYNDWSILIDAAISTQGKLDDVDNGNNSISSNNSNINSNNSNNSNNNNNNVTISSNSGNTEVKVEINTEADQHPPKESANNVATTNNNNIDDNTNHTHPLCSGDTTVSDNGSISHTNITNIDSNSCSTDINNNNNNNSNSINNNNNNNNNILLCPILKKSNPNNSFVGYEISKLPLRKRHLVPESAYYNIHQCLASPQSPPTPKQSSTHLFGGSGSGNSLNEAQEQRVPSPNTKKEVVVQQQQHQQQQQQVTVKPPAKPTEEDEVDVEGVDEEFFVDKSLSYDTQHRTVVESVTPPLTSSNGVQQQPTPIKVAESTLVKVESDQEMEVDILVDDEESSNSSSSHRSKGENTPVKKEHSHHHHSHHDGSHKKRSKHQRSRHSHKKVRREKERPASSGSDTAMYESESDSVSDEEEEDSGDNRLYCVCRKKYDSNSFMIACDKCDEWYHGECVNISEKDAKKIDRYVCMKCKKKDKHNSGSHSSNNNNSSSSNITSSNNNINNNSNNSNNSNNHNHNNHNSHNNNSNNSSNNSNNRDSIPPASPKVTPSQPNLTNSPLLQSSDYKHYLSTSNNTSPTHSSNSNNPSPTSSSSSLPSSKPDVRRCSYSKCSGFTSGPSKYCSKECGVANAKEIINKNPSIQRSVLSAPNSPPNSTVAPAPAPAAGTATASTTKSSPPVSDSNPLTQKLMSTSNCDDISKLKEISQKRSEIETKLKKLEKKSSEFEKTIQKTKFRAESAELYNNISTKGNIDGPNSTPPTPKPNNSPPSITPCVFPQKESATGICGVLNCTEHPNWEKKKREFFTKEQSLYTKALRDIALEEKQIHQRIARRNKIANMSFPVGCETGSSSDY
ncbi:hypothetical protein SAMD00019534_081760 [Acytostelium subglobosum LB1]|uniref:hypothetical protein n=1 Tax=Acytostelium subglobosum LB1 TaxID=1410327 RepID=UPI0006450120|nr:hypothetical protein SAMD00019534_081760 [Acytostelium subglobosum LB1]GAM25001.1 hypothetical protein SAMD00019534_081760 [Acytostelium subglobosum LB1]|eukprot:XP_012752090.1 hypothetical protein SAMD00019534_081760 [Acytostelium subglobosum LB1]